MNKEEYTTLEIEIIEFMYDDVITASPEGGPDSGEWHE